MLNFCQWKLYARLGMTCAFAALCASCVLDLPSAIAEARLEVKKDLRQPDIEGQKALIESWYGRLLLVLYERSADGQIELRKKLDSQGVEQLEALMQEVAADLSRVENFAWKDHEISEMLHLRSSREKIKIEVLRDDYNYVHISTDCTDARIILSAQAIREIVLAGLKQREVNEIEELTSKFALEMFQIDASADELSINGTVVEVLYGAPLSVYLTRKVARELGAQGTVVWKAFAFIIGHEAHHIWTRKCERDQNDLVHQKTEVEADVLGIMLSITSYNRRCGRKLQARIEDVRLMFGIDSSEYKIPDEVALQMSLVPSPELLVGASGFGQMQEALGKILSNDSSHPPASVRLTIDARGASALSSRLYRQPLKSSLLASVVAGLAGISMDEMLEYAYGDVRFAPNYRLVDGFMVCTDIEFEDRPASGRGF